MVIFFFPQRLLRFKIHLNIVLDLDEMRDLILVSTNITLQKGQKSTRKCLPMSDLATLSTGLQSVKEKTTLWNGVNYAVRTEMIVTI